jgi:hypothetical protein
MNRYIDQQQTMTKISELVTLRDNLQASARDLAGKANFYGYKMRGLEHNRKYMNIADWVNASLSPFGLLTKSLTTFSDRLRGLKTTTSATRKLLKIMEELVFWGHVLDDLTTAIAATTPWGAVLHTANVEVSLILKATKLRNLEKFDAWKTSMDYFWNTSLEFQRLCPVAVAELNREINELR